MGQCLCPDAALSVACNTVFFQIALLYWRSTADVDRLFSFGVGLKRRFLDTDYENGDLALTDFLFKSLPNTAYTEHTITSDPLVQAVNPLADAQVLFDGLCPDEGCAAFEFLVTGALSDFFSINANNLQYGALSPKTFPVNVVRQDDDGVGGYRQIATAANPVLYIPQITCVNTVYLGEAMKQFVNNPPQILTQPYSQCHMTQRAALLSAIGTSAGSATLYSTIIFGLTVFMVVRIINNSAQNPTDVLVAPAEKERTKTQEENRAKFKMFDTVELLIRATGVHEKSAVATDYLDFYDTNIKKMREEFTEELEKMKLREAELKERIMLIKGRRKVKGEDDSDSGSGSDSDSSDNVSGGRESDSGSDDSGNSGLSLDGINLTRLEEGIRAPVSAASSSSLEKPSAIFRTRSDDRKKRRAETRKDQRVLDGAGLRRLEAAPGYVERRERLEVDQARARLAPGWDSRGVGGGGLPALPNLTSWFGLSGASTGPGAAGQSAESAAGGNRVDRRFNDPPGGSGGSDSDSGGSSGGSSDSSTSFGFASFNSGTVESLVFVPPAPVAPMNQRPAGAELAKKAKRAKRGTEKLEKLGQSKARQAAAPRTDTDEL